MDTLVDNDILMKSACYGLLEQLLSPASQDGGNFGILGAARFVIRKAIEKAVLQGDRALALDRFEAFINSVHEIEPTDEEQVLAAKFELAAQLAGVALDTGESQLCAVMIVRGLGWLYTGDKRAIQALDDLIELENQLASVCGKLVCLEQLFVGSLVDENFDSIRAAVCSEPGMDRALSVCFSCTSKAANLEIVREGLNSYIGDLRKRASRVLAA